MIRVVPPNPRLRRAHDMVSDMAAALRDVPDLDDPSARGAAYARHCRGLSIAVFEAFDAQALFDARAFRLWRVASPPIAAQVAA